MKWRPSIRGSYTLRLEGEDVGNVVKIERGGRMGWFWHMYVNGKDGFCDTLQEAKAQAEQAASPQFRR